MKHLSTVVMSLCLCLLGTTWVPISNAQAHDNRTTELQQQQVLPPNFVPHEDKEAKLIVPLWVKYINGRNYDAAANLWIPEEREWRRKSQPLQVFYKNIERLTLLQYKDVTTTWGGIPMDLSRFYAVKVYIAVLDYKAYDWQIANTMLGKKMQRCFVVKETQSSPWRLFMMQGYSPYSAQKSWGLDLSGITGYGPQYHPDYTNLNASQSALYQDFIKQCIGPSVQRAVDKYNGTNRRIAYWDMDILDLKRITEKSYWFEITVRVRSNQGSYRPPYGVEIITLTNQTKTGDYEVVKYVHRDES